MAIQAMEGFVVAMLNIRKDLIPCVWMLGVVHAHDVHNHLVDNFCLSISLGVEGSGFGKISVQK